MDLFDTLWELGDIAKDIVTFPFEVGKAVTELGEDIKETIVQDVQHKIEGNPDKPIRTSYTVKEEAENLISKSGNEYWDARDEFSTQWNRMTATAEKLQTERYTTYKLIGQAIRSKRLTELPSSIVPSQQPASIPSIDSIKFDFGTYLGSTSMRMEAAEEYLSKAKEYRIRVKTKIAELNQLKRLVLNVSAFQNEELEMLSLIRKSYENQNESTLLKSTEILRELASLCLDEVCEQTNTNYEHLLEKLKTLWM